VLNVAQRLFVFAAERVISPVMKEAPSSNEDDDEDDDAVEEEKSPQIVVTVGGLSTTRNAKNRKIKVSNKTLRNFKLTGLLDNFSAVCKMDAPMWKNNFQFLDFRH